MTSQPTSLYRFFDAEGELLYIGISMRLLVRVIEHRRAAWFGDAARIEIEHFESREAALEAERQAIRGERPKHNQALALELPPMLTAQQLVQELPPLVTREEVAQIWSCHISKVDRCIKDGTLPAVKLGRLVRVRREHVLGAPSH